MQIDEALELYLLEGRDVFLRIADLLHGVGARPSPDRLSRSVALLTDAQATALVARYSAIE